MSRCSDCGAWKELRPYGQGGELICSRCVMASQEAEDLAVEQIKKRQWEAEDGRQGVRKAS